MSYFIRINISLTATQNDPRTEFWILVLSAFFGRRKVYQLTAFDNFKNKQQKRGAFWHS